MSNKIATSTPTFGEFQPVIPYQDQVIDDVYTQFDYEQGVHEILLSGSVGSAKSILMAHLIVRHCLESEGAKALIGRKALGDLRDTLYAKIVEHLADEQLKEGYHYKLYDRECRILFPPWGSEIMARSWADTRYEKVRSLEISFAAIEELTENKDDDAYREIKMRVGRQPHVKKNIIIAATNPDAPSHWAHNYFINPNEQSKHPTRHVYYSVTTDNPFLPAWYIEQLKKDLDPKMVQRMIYGKWIEINSEVIYYSYDSKKSYRDYEYKIRPELPIMFTHDFNIGVGKPMSCVLGQYHPDTDTYHWFAEMIIEGARTGDIMEEAISRGYLEHEQMFEIYGDATGDRNDTRSLLTDYDIIKRAFANYRRKKDGGIPRWIMNVPKSNPSLRSRHNIVNGYCFNALGETRFFVYKGAKTLDTGMRLTTLVDGGQYVENDKPHYQHCTTAVGYCILYKHNLKGIQKIGVY